MPVAAPHREQKARLAALRSFDILDTPREEEFDDIVALASEICGAPISVVNLIDENRQWFKAEVGLGARETPLATSICSHVILSDDFVEINDTMADPRTADNELCLAPSGLRFYAGALLKTRSGLPIGTLCVLDITPRQLTDFQRKTLKVLAHHVMRHLELRKALRDQQVLRAEMDHRVKNSLQTVASFVSLYARAAETETAKEGFAAVSRRIQSIATLHDELSHAAQDGIVELDGYLRKVVDLLQVSAPDHVSIKLSVPQRPIEALQATGLGFIVSEFVANSVKHAFSNGSPGVVSISSSSLPDENLILLCRDNGTSFSKPGLPTSKGNGLGQKILKASASQIGAAISQEITKQGFAMTITFQE
jgi:two-component sensor histidine kinase